MYDVVIVGGGPAGQTAALFMSKAGLSTLLIDNEKGLTQRALVKNHYGIQEISGKDLVDTGMDQSLEFGTEFVKGQVTAITPAAPPFTIHTEDGKAFEAKQVILGTGANQRLAESIGLKVREGTEPYVPSIIDVTSEGKTAIDGIWACGTAAGVSVHTIITSGDGAKVAVNLLSELNGERYVDHDAL